jgi:hypothetical protein
MEEYGENCEATFLICRLYKILLGWSNKEECDRKYVYQEWEK